MHRIQQLASDPDLCASMGALAREASEQHWDKGCAMAQWEKVLEAVGLDAEPFLVTALVCAAWWIVERRGSEGLSRWLCNRKAEESSTDRRSLVFDLLYHAANRRAGRTLNHRCLLWVSS